LPALAALVLAAASAAAARELPTSRVTETQAYAGADQAAVAALRIAMPLSQDYENGGAIIERDGAFYYSDPVSNGDTGHIVFKAAFPEGGRLAAIYHTHPSSEEDSRMFSWDDVNEARKLNVDSYIGVLGDGTIRFFDPRKTPTHPYQLPGTPISPGRVSDGVIIATIINK
jgi:proteasome lid subunit RPN8/RPN11